MKFVILGAILLGFGLVGAASAEVPVFSAECPLGKKLDADWTGIVRVNGTVARVEKFNEHYYEARLEGFAYSISHEGGGSGLSVSYSGLGGANGICTILVSAQRPPSATGGGMARVTGVSSNDVLNVRTGPSTRYDVKGALANGDRVRLIGCQDEGTSRWCKIRFLDDMGGEGWANARYLSIEIAGQLPSPPVAASTSTVRVHFAVGTSGAELTDSLLPGASRRYVLGAGNGQDLYVRVAARGPNIFYQIFNPDGSFLLDQISADREYGGQLWQSGDHVVEVINRGNGAQSYNVSFVIQ